MRDELPLALEEAVKGALFPFRVRLGKYFILKIEEGVLGYHEFDQVSNNNLDIIYSPQQSNQRTVIDQIVNNTNYKTDKEGASDILILLLEGHDTTAFSLSWILLELAKSSNEQCVLRSEILKYEEHERDNLEVLRNAVKRGLRL